MHNVTDKPSPRTRLLLELLAVAWLFFTLGVQIGRVA